MWTPTPKGMPHLLEALDVIWEKVVSDTNLPAGQKDQIQQHITQLKSTLQAAHGDPARLAQAQQPVAAQIDALRDLLDPAVLDALDPGMGSCSFPTRRGNTCVETTAAQCAQLSPNSTFDPGGNCSPQPTS